jgi:undecaprenyl diphosphate synthase
MEADLAQPPVVRSRLRFSRLPRHVGIIPDGNRRWAEARGEPRRTGYSAGLAPGFQLMQLCRELGIEEATVYGYTKENVQRPADQVRAFRAACVEFADWAVAAGVALHVIGDSRSSAFPPELVPFAERRSAGDMRVNLLVNYGWSWDLAAAARNAASDASRAELSRSLASAGASRIDLVVRWGGRRRLSGFLPVQCAYADIHVIDTLWPDMTLDEFIGALRWYEQQDVTLGG